MKKFRAKAALFLIPVALTLLRDGGATDPDAKYKLVPNNAWYSSGARPPPTSKSKEDELLKEILPRITFDCLGKAGYFSDAKFDCTVFHYCKHDGVRNTFHCPPNSIFNQLSMLCEEKTEINTKLCTEGSIAAKTSMWTPSTKPKTSSSVKQVQSHEKPININKTASDLKVGTFQQLLTLVNDELNVNKQNNSKMSSDKLHAKIHSDSSNGESAKNNSKSKDRQKHDVNSKHPDMVITASMSVIQHDKTKQVETVHGKRTTRGKSSRSRNSENESTNTMDFIPLETTRRPRSRKHKRRGRVLDLDTAGSESVKQQQTDNESHVQTVADAETSTKSDGVTPTGEETESNSKLPSLFAVSDRNRSKDYRKRRRNHRRRKNQKTEDIISTDATADQSGEAEKTEMTTAGNEADGSQFRRRKTLPEKDGVFEDTGNWQGISNPHEKRKKHYKIRTHSEHPSANDTNSEGSNRNPWFKKSKDDPNTRFGIRNPVDGAPNQNEQYGSTEGTMGPSDFFGHHEFPKESEEWSVEEIPFRETPPKISRKRKHKRKHSSSHSEKNSSSDNVDDEAWFQEPPQNSEETFTPDPFPPPRSQSSKLSESKPEDDLETGEDEFRTKTPYKDHYFPKIKELAELEKNRWKVSDHAESSKKINVGDSVDKNHEKKPNFMENASSSMHKSIEAMNAIRASVKQLPKHTAAHQQLSKLMNEFFSMSSKTQPGVNLKSAQTGANIHIPKYRIPDEDLYKAEAEAEPVDELPPEVLDVVEYIAEQQAMKKGKSRHEYGNHEIVKVDTPIKELFGEEIEKLLADEKIFPQATNVKNMPKQMVLVPEEKDSDEEAEQEFKEIAELASFTSQRLEPLLKTVLQREKAIQLVPFRNVAPTKQNISPPNSAKNLPVQVIYRGRANQYVPKAPSSIATTAKPNFKVIRSQLPRPNLQVIHNNRMVPAANSHFLVLQPPSLVPPHPPPLPSNPLPPVMNYPRLSPMRSLRSPFRFRSRRRKRSLVSRLRRQVAYNPNNNPFYNPFFKSFSPNFTPHFRQFRNLFGSPSSTLLNTAGSHHFPFAFPTVRAPKLQQPLRQNYLPRHPPLRPIHQTSHQTMVVEEVPVPVHIDIQPSLLPQHSQLQHVRHLHQSPFHEPIRHSQPDPRRPPRLHRPPLLNNNFLKPVPIKNDVTLGAPFPLNVPHSPELHLRPPLRNPRPSIYNPRPPMSKPRPPRPNSKPPRKQTNLSSNSPDHALPLALPLALPVAQGPQNTHAKPSGQPKPLLYSPYNAVKPIPHGIRNQLIGHLNSFPGMGKPQSNPVDQLNHFAHHQPGILMHSGYKPPKAENPRIKSNNSTFRNPTKTPSDQPEPPAGYLEITYKKNVGRTTPKPTRTYGTPPIRNKNIPFEIPQITPQAPTIPYYRPIPKHTYPSSSSSSLSASEESKPKRKRPSRRRRPRPRPPPLYTPPARPPLSVSPTPPPPQQIPPPPADFTSKPFYHTEDVSNSIQSNNVEAKPTITKEQNIFPPAGYYGRDQIGQLFENIKKTEQHPAGILPKRPSELEPADVTSLSTASSSNEDIEADDPGGEPVFGARLTSKNRRKNRDPQKSSQTQRTETRARQSINQPHRKLPAHDSRPPMTTYVEPDRPKRQPPPPPRRRKPVPLPRPPEKESRGSRNMPEEIVYPKPVTPSPDFFNVPGGLGNVVAPSAQLQPGGNVPRDMFGIPIPYSEPNIFSDFRPPDTKHRNFFSVPEHIIKQQLAPLQRENPSSFLAPVNENTAPKSHRGPSTPVSTTEERPKRRKRIRVKSRHRVTPKTSTVPTEETTTEPTHYTFTTTEEKTTLPPTTRTLYRSTSTPRHQSDFVKKRYTESNRKNNAPPTLQEVSKSLMEGKLDIKKLNATISTSVSVSGGNNALLGGEQRKVFSSKNGGLAVVKNNPRQRKKAKSPKVTVSTVNNDESSTENGIKSDEKLQIASSVIDIIKATAETELKLTTTTDPSMPFSSTKLSKTWVLKPTAEHDIKKIS